LESSALNTFKKRALKSKRLSVDLLDESDDRLLEKLHLFDSQYLKRASVLLFHPEPEKYITGAFIKIGYFQNNADILIRPHILIVFFINILY